VSIPMTLSDLEKRDARGQIFPADLRNYPRAVWRRTIAFVKATQVGRGFSVGGQPLSFQVINVPILGFWHPIHTPIRFDLVRPNSVWSTSGEGAGFNMVRHVHYPKALRSQHS